MIFRDFDHANFPLFFLRKNIPIPMRHEFFLPGLEHKALPRRRLDYIFMVLFEHRNEIELEIGVVADIAGNAVRISDAIEIARIKAR